MNDSFPTIILYLGIALGFLGTPFCILNKLPCFNDMGDREKFITLGIGTISLITGLILITVSFFVR